MSEAETVVRTMLGEAGLPVTEEEIAVLVGTYADFKAGVESLYAVRGSRYESPALHFDPRPAFSDWG
jgi:hypothetical protein